MKFKNNKDSIVPQFQHSLKSHNIIGWSMHFTFFNLFQNKKLLISYKSHQKERKIWEFAGERCDSAEMGQISWGLCDSASTGTGERPCQLPTEPVDRSNLRLQAERAWGCQGRERVLLHHLRRLCRHEGVREQSRTARGHPAANRQLRTDSRPAAHWGTSSQALRHEHGNWLFRLRKGKFF